MKNSRSPRRPITPAKQGQIIQRIIVDGWSSAQAADYFGVSQHLVDAWVADFRRNGMASLRQDPGRTFGGEFLQLTILQPVRLMMRRVSIGLRRSLPVESQVQPVPLRHFDKDGP
jgi:transposase-like protein